MKQWKKVTGLCSAMITVLLLTLLCVQTVPAVEPDDDCSHPSFTYASITVDEGHRKKCSICKTIISEEQHTYEVQKNVSDDDFRYSDYYRNHKVKCTLCDSVNTQVCCVSSIGVITPAKVAAEKYTPVDLTYHYQTLVCKCGTEYELKDNKSKHTYSGGKCTKCGMKKYTKPGKTSITSKTSVSKASSYKWTSKAEWKYDTSAGKWVYTPSKTQVNYKRTYKVYWKKATKATKYQIKVYKGSKCLWTQEKKSNGKSTQSITYKDTSYTNTTGKIKIKVTPIYETPYGDIKGSTATKYITLK